MWHIARGAGMAWGLAEEASEAVVWLQSRGLPGVPALCRYLSAYQLQKPLLLKWTGIQHEDNTIPYCPLTIGTAISDEAITIPSDVSTGISLGLIRQPILLLPFISASLPAGYGLYVGRTFIEPSQKIRSLGVKLKLNANQSTIKNKKIILIDDSLVRGTTSHKIVKMLYDAGAKEVHVRIACPEIKYPDFYGVDTPTKKELLAANKTNDEICEYIGAKSLKFLSLDGLYKAIGFDKRNETYPQLTDHYFTGDYPVKPIDELGDSKVTQLSLLSTASNN